MATHTHRSISPAGASAAPPGPWREFWTAFSANRGAVIGLVVIVVLLLVALFAPWIAPHAPNETNSAVFLQPPAWQQGGSLSYLLGTDAIGRDIFSRLITARGCRCRSVSRWW
jgi:dipeptide transport system permease protein